MQRIEIIRRVEARPETVFSYFTDSSRYARWMGVEATLDPRPGGIYRVLVPQGHTTSGEFLEVDPPRRLVYSFGWEGHPDVPPGSTTVEVTFTEEGNATIVRLIHTGIPTAEDAAIHTTGWDRYLDRLVTAASGGDPGPEQE